jgi:hypothetical protein
MEPEWREAVEQALADQGFAFLGDDWHSGSPFPDWYHSAFHQPWYVFQHWGRLFDVAAYVSRASLDFQDFVVMRRAAQPRATEPAASSVASPIARKAPARHLYENPDEAREKGVQGQMRIRSEHSLERTAEFIAERLDVIQPPKRSSADPAEDSAEVELPGLEAAAEYVEGGPEAILEGVSPHGRLGSAARITLFRILKPYTVRHREFAREVLTAIAALDAKIAGKMAALDVKIDRLHEEVADADSELFERLERLEYRLSAFEGVTDRAIRRLGGEPTEEDPATPA